MLRGGDKARKLQHHHSMANSGFPYSPKIGLGYIGGGICNDYIIVCPHLQGSVCIGA